MFRLMKLLAYALFGYALYEFFRGMTAEAGGMGGGQQRMGGSMSGMGREVMGGGAHGQISGPAEGREEATLESDGGSVRRRVGRGVIPSGM